MGTLRRISNYINGKLDYYTKNAPVILFVALIVLITVYISVPKTKQPFVGSQVTKQPFVGSQVTKQPFVGGYQVTKQPFVGNQVTKQPFVGGCQVEPFEMIRVGSNEYKVHEDLANPIHAAETMDALNKVALNFISSIHSKYIGDSLGLQKIKPEFRDIVRKGILQMRKNFKTANLEENIPERSGGDTSYVIDKGEVFAMCLRDPRKGNVVDNGNNMNELKFVLLHELAHLFTSTFGHDTLFWNNFKFMLQEAVTAKLYTPINYKKNGHPYCGIVISYSPLYDVDLKQYLLDP